MKLRDDAEAVILAWNEYELRRGAKPVIDYDCTPRERPVEPAPDRLWVLNHLVNILGQATDANEESIAARVTADITYLCALLGERQSLSSYIAKTQGCGSVGWSDEYLAWRRDILQSSLDSMSIKWDESTENELAIAEGALAVADAPDAIRDAAAQFESAVRLQVGSTAAYTLEIELADIDAYWSYWLDGARDSARLRLNLRQAQFTLIQARQFALHEILGHALQGASYFSVASGVDVPWVRFLSVHAPQQVLLEGLAQALPLFVAPDDVPLTSRVRLAHYLQLVRARLHIAINDGASITDCVATARRLVPFWSDAAIADTLSDRGANPLLRSYLWSYSAGIDWFVALAEAGADVSAPILQAAYAEPLTPVQLQRLWPEGPAFGG